MREDERANCAVDLLDARVGEVGRVGDARGVCGTTADLVEEVVELGDLVERVVRRAPDFRLGVRERRADLVHHLTDTEAVPGEAILREQLLGTLARDNILLRPAREIPHPARHFDVVWRGWATLGADVGDERLDLVHQAVLEQAGRRVLRHAGLAPVVLLVEAVVEGGDELRE